MNHSSPFVLLIDDDKDDLELLSASLEMAGIRIKTFESGIQALHYLSLLPSQMDLPYMIILDYNMPKKKGDQILMAIKNCKAIRSIPVVMYSTTISDAYAKHLEDLGALDSFTKPWTYNDYTKQVGIFKDLAFSLTTTIN